MDDLSGRVAVVTGGARGIGEAYCRALAGAGATVVVADRDGAGADATAAALVASGATASAIEVDVADRDSTLAVAATVAERHGTAHILVNNAAVFHSMRIDPQLTVDIEYWRRVFAVNLDGALLMTQALGPQLIAAGWGRVINQASTAAWGNGGAYGITKLALIGLTRGFARELGPHGITVNAIAPGPIETEALASTVSEERLAAIVAGAAIKRLGTVDDLTGTLLHLCSDGAQWVTAQTFVVDGGSTPRY